MTLGLGGGDFLILFLGVATLLLAEWYQEKKGPIRPMLERQSPFLQWVAILVPLFISAFRRADELATAMECRCYHGGEGRTALRVLRYKAADWLVLVAFLALTAGIIVLKKLGF